MSLKLTKTVVDRAKPEAKDRFLWDGELAGFGLKVCAGGERSIYVNTGMEPAAGLRRGE